MKRYSESERREWVKRAASEATLYISEHAGVTRESAKNWIQKYWSLIRRVDTYSSLVQQKNHLKVQQRELNKIKKDRDFYKALFLEENCPKSMRRELAWIAVRELNVSHTQACEMLGITRYYFKQGDDGEFK